MSENKPKFTPRPWKRTFTTIPFSTDGLDTSSDIVNITIGDRNIPLAVLAMNSSKECSEYYATMVVNAQLMAMAPEMYEAIERNVLLIKALADTFKTRNHDEDDEFSQDLYKKATELDKLLARARGEE